MYFVILFVLSWIWFTLMSDKSRLRELYGVVIYTCYLGLLTDLIMVHYQLWSYKGLPQSSFTIPLLLDFSVYPAVCYLFVQNLPPTWGGIIKRTVIWVFFAILLEWITLRTGNMQHHMWWNLGFSATADIMIFLSIAGVYRYYGSAYSRTSSMEKY